MNNQSITKEILNWYDNNKRILPWRKHLTKKQKPLIDDENYIKFNKIVSNAFNQRRKMLKNSIKHWNFSDKIIKNIDFTRRPETLSIKEFASLIE